MIARRLIPVALLPLAVVILSGCQIGGPPPPEAYERLGNAICANKTEELRAVAAKKADPATTEKERSGFGNVVSGIHRSELASLKQLTPPDALRTRAESMYAAYSDIMRMVEGKKARAGESMTLTEATAQLNARLKALALTECVRTLEEGFPTQSVN